MGQASPETRPKDPAAGSAESALFGSAGFVLLPMSVAPRSYGAALSHQET